MFKNHFKTVVRHIACNRFYSAVNVLGLTLGICACIAIYTIIHFEFSFDTHHKNSDRIYRVMTEITESTGDITHFGRMPVSIAQTATSGFTGIENATVIIPFSVKITVPAGDQPRIPFESVLPSTHFITTALTSPSWFDLFNYRLLAGNTTSLSEPFTTVLTESRARQYFGPGSLNKILGKTIVYGDSLSVTVAGIVADPPGNTDLGFTDFIAAGSVQTTGMYGWAFIRLGQGASLSSLNGRLERIPKLREEQGVARKLWLEPLSEMHFNSNAIENSIRTADRPLLISLTGIAVFILLLAIVNFINLSTAQSIQRAKEVGVRKVLGSSRSALVVLFLTEACVLTFFACILALLLVRPALYAFRDFIPAGINFHMFDPAMIVFLLLVMLATTGLAGYYPAKVLSAYRPVNSLKGAGNEKVADKWLIRKGLIVFQFVVSLVFITGSIVIAKQLHFTRVKNLGFSSNAIVITDVPGGGYARLAVFAGKIKQVPGVAGVALQWVPPMTDNTRGMKLKFSPSDDKDFWVTQVAGNEAFIPLYHIGLLAGRNLLAADSVRELVINETLSKMMGDSFPSGSIGKTLYWNDKPYPVVGVVADFHTKSLHDPVTPLCIINRQDRLGAVAISMAPGSNAAENMQAGLATIGRLFKEVYPEGVFTYRFFDASIAMLYEKDRKTAALINAAAGISIFISCIGLFGLALFTAKKRAREISIRKVLGAGIPDIAAMLSKDFLVLVIIAILIATPLAWYFTHQWLQGFAYKIEISVWIFILAGAAAVTVALLSVSVQSIKAAMMNPVKNMRNE